MINEFELKNDQTDLISDIQFSPTDNKFLSSSWDNSINIFDTEKWEIIQKIKVDSPQLSVIFNLKDSKTIYSAGLSGEILFYNFNDFRKSKIGDHSMPISKLIVDSDNGNIYSGSWDKTVKCWDPHRDNTKLFSISFEDKVHNLCQIKNRLIVSVGNSFVKVFDKRNLNECLKTININSTIRSVNQFKDSSVLIGSIDGKINIQYLNQEGGYSFKCHRIEKEDEIVAYPVNYVEPHPNKEIFISGGSDGFLYYWDYENKKKIKRSNEYPGSINHCKFDKDGSKLAISIGNISEEDVDINR